MNGEAKAPLILIVDDVPQNLQILGNLMKKIECEITAAARGDQALEIARRNRPDLILLDVMMPGKDGYQTCRALKSDPATREIPVIFLTAKVETEDILTGFEAGAVDYVTKPFQSRELLTRVRTHLSLKQTRDELKRAVETKNKFFNIIAHDLKSPLSTIMGFSDLLNNPDMAGDPESQKRYVDYIFKSAKTASELLSNLLDWSRVQTGKLNPRPSVFSVASLFESVAELMTPAAEKKQIDLCVHPTGELTLHADFQMTFTVLRNLVSNALKFTHPDGTIGLTAAALEDGSSTKISVSDNGVGISGDRQESLFNISEKVSTRGTADEEGTGLGLILCRDFVELNDGRIGLESTEGQGSTFYFMLPSGLPEAGSS